MGDPLDTVDPDTDPAIALALTDRLAGLLDRVQQGRRRVARHGRPRDVHQLRGNLRRLAVTAGLATDAIELPAKLGPRIQAIVGGLGDLRDTDVLIALVATLAATAPAEASRELEALGGRLLDRRAKQLAGARRFLRQTKSRRPLLELRRLLRHPHRLPFGFRPVSAAGQLLIDAGWERLLEDQGWRIAVAAAVDLTREHERALHELRRDVKRQRDTIDGFGNDPEAVERLNRIADRLGHLHDLGTLHQVVPARYRGARLAVRLALDAEIARWAADRRASRLSLRLGGSKPSLSVAASKKTSIESPAAP